MIQTAISTITLLSVLSLSAGGGISAHAPKPQKVKISEEKMSLNNRLEGKYLNDVYKDNILLNMGYMRGIVNKSAPVNWDEIRQPFTYEFDLNPGQTFAYHDSVKKEYINSVARTSNSHFGAQEGYKSDGRLYGMGVCHLASVINRAAKSADLDSVAPTNHNFAVIREVPREFGVAIYSSPDAKSVSELQNLYITNNLDSNITFKFEYDGDILKVSVLKDN